MHVFRKSSSSSQGSEENYTQNGNSLTNESQKVSYTLMYRKFRPQTVPIDKELTENSITITLHLKERNK